MERLLRHALRVTDFLHTGIEALGTSEDLVFFLALRFGRFHLPPQFSVSNSLVLYPRPPKIQGRHARARCWEDFCPACHLAVSQVGWNVFLERACPSLCMREVSAVLRLIGRARIDAQIHVSFFGGGLALRLLWVGGQVHFAA